MLKAELTTSFSYLVKKNVELFQHSQWRIGGIADYFAEPENLTELKTILSGATSAGIPFQIIGNGTNILFDDKGYRGLIIKISRGFNKTTINEERVIAEAGIWMPCLARLLANQGLSGLEHTIGIPGNLGGLVFMNGGSSRKSLSENIRKVFALDYSCKELIFNKDECDFSQRHSMFQYKPLIVYKVELGLTRYEPLEIRSAMLSILKNRKAKFPLKFPNCGSTFISNSTLYDSLGTPGKIIEELGLKGYHRGGAMISELHANFIINKGNASSKDIIEIVKHVRMKIYKKTNIWVLSEIRYLKPDGGFYFLHEQY